MTTGIASKNLFELLGNDPDSDGEIRAPPKQIVKQVQTTKKKDAAPETAPPAANRGGRQGRGNRYSGNEAAYRDRTAGSDANRSKRTDEPHSGPHGERTEGRGQRGRGYGGRGRQYDRRSGGHPDTEKKVNQGWGSDEKELEEEVAGAAIAQTEATQDPAAATAEETQPAFEEAAAPQEPEETFKTYDDYLAEVKAKKEALGSLPQARQANEGTRGDDKWKNAVPVKKEEEEEEVFIAGKEAKARKERERKQKQVVDVDMRFQEAPRRGGGERGGRGGRGGRGDGERRGGRGGQQGGFRGGEHRGGERRGGNRANGPSVNLADTNAFPSLGGN